MKTNWEDLLVKGVVFVLAFVALGIVFTNVPVFGANSGLVDLGLSSLVANSFKLK